MSVLQKLESWQKAGLIDARQKQIIMDYENSQSSHKLSRIVYFLACFTIGLGIISIIAANWDALPSGLKILCDFILLSLTALAAFKFEKLPHSNKFEGTLLFFAMLILGSIGLIAQVFNLQSDNLSAILLWSVLTAPLLVQTKKIALPIVWLPMFFVSLVDCLSDWLVFENWWRNFSSAFLLAPMSFVTLIACFFYVIFKYAFNERNHQLVSAAKFWLIVVWIYSILSANNPYLVNILSYIHKPTEVNYLYAGLTSVFFLITAFAAFKVLSSPLLAQNMGIMFLMGFLYQFIGQNSIIRELWSIVLTLSVLGVTLWHVNKSQNYKLADFISALIALRIFGIYLQVIGDLSMTGIGLIASGIILLLLIKLWYKLKQNRGLKGNDDEK